MPPGGSGPRRVAPVRGAGRSTVHGADAAPLATTAVVGTTGVFQHPEHALAVMAVNADAAAALGPTPHPTRRDPWLRAAARCRITVHDHLARIWEPRSRRGPRRRKSTRASPQDRGWLDNPSAPASTPLFRIYAHTPPASARAAGTSPSGQHGPPLTRRSRRSGPGPGAAAADRPGRPAG